MHRIAMAGQCGELDVVLFEEIQPCGKLRVIGEEHLGITVILARETAAADLNRFHTHSLEHGQDFFERLFRIQIGKYAEFHRYLYPFCF